MTTGRTRHLRVTFLNWRDTTHPDGGGSERYIEEVARRLVRGGDQVTVLCAAHGTARADEVVDGVKLRRRGGRLTVYLHGLLFLCSAEGRAQDVVVDVVNGIPFAARLVRRSGIVVLVHHLHREQWQMIYPGVRGRFGWLVESRLTPLLYRRTAYVTVSQSTKADLLLLGISPCSVAVIRNGVDMPTPIVAEPRSNNPRICVLSRLVPHKRIEDALQAMAALRHEFPDLHLDLIGDGWWGEQLHAICAELGLLERVTFHGRLSDDRRDQLLAQAWIMLTPSIKEGWAIAIMEAAALGTPTIAYRRAGGVTESIVDGETGFLASDQDDLIRLSSEVLRDGDLRTRLSAAANRRAQGFSWDDTARQFRTVLVQVATDRCQHARRATEKSTTPVLDDLPGGRVCGRRRCRRRYDAHSGDGREDRAD